MTTLPPVMGAGTQLVIEASSTSRADAASLLAQTFALVKEAAAPDLQAAA